MNELKRDGAIGALLSEYEKAILELQNVISDVTTSELTSIVDNSTSDPDCRSIQTVLTHVVRSGYSYCIYIRDHLKIKNDKIREDIIRWSVAEYKQDLDQVLEFTRVTFAGIRNDELEQYDNAKKIKTSWGQFYDLEQLFEHAIVHILRHRRQIERFKKILKNN